MYYNPFMLPLLLPIARSAGLSVESAHTCVSGDSKRSHHLFYKSIDFSVFVNLIASGEIEDACTLFILFKHVLKQKTVVEIR
jgi:hypothetical protein